MIVDIKTSNMAHEIRLQRFEEFNPEPDKWRNDNRNYRQATESIEVMVAKNFSKFGLPCVGIYPVMDCKKGFIGFKVAAPDGPLKHYFEQEDTKKILFGLFGDAVIDAMAKKEKKRKGEEVDSSTDVIRTIVLTKPPVPVWNLTLKQAETFFSNLKSELAKKDHIKLKRKWPKMVDGKATELPTAIPSYDEVAEIILPSSIYFPFQKFPPGNLHWRLKLVCAYFFLKNGFDPNTFAQKVPDGFKAKKFTLEQLVKFSNDMEKSAEEHHNPKRKRKPVVRQESIEFDVPFYEVDNFDYEESDSDDDLPLVSSQVRLSDPSSLTSTGPTPGPGSSPVPLPGPSQRRSEQIAAMPTTGITSQCLQPSQRFQVLESQGTCNLTDDIDATLPNGVVVRIPRPQDLLVDICETDDVFNTSHSTGTPGNSAGNSIIEDENNLMDDLEKELNENEEIFAMMETTDIRNILTGDTSVIPTVQLYNFKKMTKAQCFKVNAHDGKRAATKFIFCANLNERLSALVKNYPIVRLTKFKLYNGSFVFIEDFEVVQILDTKIGDAEDLTEIDYERMKRNLRPNSAHPQTPTLVTKKLTKRHVEEVNRLPSRSASIRVKNRSVGNNA